MSPLTFTVTEEDVGTRLDKFLSDQLPDLSRERVKAHITAGKVMHNNGAAQIPAKPSARVEAGDTLTITLLPETEISLEAEDIPLEIVFEDDHVIVVNKPAGMVVHPADGTPNGTLVNALLHHTGGQLSSQTAAGMRPGIVHRLDKDTSGVMVACKTNAAYEGLQPQFANHSIDRQYTAFIWGLLNPMSGTIEGNIGRDPNHRQRMTVISDPENPRGKPAITHYETADVFGTTASQLNVTLETGRTHQIRVHLTHKGRPIIGDAQYARNRRKPFDFPRQALHAALLGFIHPVTGKKMKFEAPLPDDLIALIDKLSDSAT